MRDDVQDPASQRRMRLSNQERDLDSGRASEPISIVMDHFVGGFVRLGGPSCGIQVGGVHYAGVGEAREHRLAELDLANPQAKNFRVNTSVSWILLLL